MPYITRPLRHAARRPTMAPAGCGRTMCAPTERPLRAPKAPLVKGGCHEVAGGFRLPGICRARRPRRAVPWRYLFYGCGGFCQTNQLYIMESPSHRLRRCQPSRSKSRRFAAVDLETRLRAQPLAKGPFPCGGRGVGKRKRRDALPPFHYCAKPYETARRVVAPYGGSGPGGHFHPDKISLGVAADGAVGGGGGGVHHEAAVEAGPLHLHLREKQLIFLHQAGELPEAVPVGLLHPGDVL